MLDKIKAYLASVYLKKAAKSAVKIIVARVIALNLEQYGVHVDPEAATVALVAGIEAARSWAKQKYNLTWL